MKNTVVKCLNMSDIIEQHIKQYPKIQARDVLKLLYQSEYGVGHLISSEGDSLRYLQEELCMELPVLCEDRPYIEEIGNGYVRVYLQAIKDGKISETTFHWMFLKSAEGKPGSKEIFLEKVQEVAKLCEQYSINIMEELGKWDSENESPFRHSEVYREAYRPAYRVMRKEYIRFWDLFCKIDEKCASQDKVVIAIDGNSAAGKSSLSKLLQLVYDCDVIAMDHFFLQPHQRTSERFNEAGGNIDYERFNEEVIAKLIQEEVFSYAPLLCENFQFGEPVKVHNKKVCVVEGSYSTHPKFGQYYDLSVFLAVESEEQVKRIMQRNGEKCLEFFVNRWIPMERKYFEAFDIKGRCDLIYSLLY